MIPPIHHIAQIQEQKKPEMAVYIKAIMSTNYDDSSSDEEDDEHVTLLSDRNTAKKKNIKPIEKPVDIKEKVVALQQDIETLTNSVKDSSAINMNQELSKIISNLQYLHARKNQTFEDMDRQYTENFRITGQKPTQAYEMIGLKTEHAHTYTSDFLEQRIQNLENTKDQKQFLKVRQARAAFGAPFCNEVAIEDYKTYLYWKQTGKQPPIMPHLLDHTLIGHLETMNEQLPQLVSKADEKGLIARTTPPVIDMQKNEPAKLTVRRTSPVEYIEKEEPAPEVETGILFALASWLFSSDEYH
ncbi:MAG: hypothetical protein NTX86_04645 [Candidatus Dependentiae bacterium]|nr:hypothetical protein [Candidatus Dependentiae bacterium]